MTCLEDKLIKNIIETIEEGKKNNWPEYLIKIDLMRIINNYTSYLINEMRADIEAEIKANLTSY